MDGGERADATCGLGVGGSRALRGGGRVSATARGRLGSVDPGGSRYAHPE